MDYEKYDKNLPRSRRGRTEGEKRADARRLLKQTQWLTYPWIYWDANAWDWRTIVDREAPPEEDLPPWLTPLKPLFRLTNRPSGLYAAKFSPQFIQTLATTDTEVIPPLFDELIPITDTLLKQTSMAIKRASQFPKVFPRLVGDIERWQQQQYALLDKAHQRFSLCQTYSVARMVYAIFLPNREFIRKVGNDSEQLFHLVQNPALPETLKIAASLILGRFSKHPTIPARYRHWGNIGAQIALNILPIVINIISKFDAPELFTLCAESHGETLPLLLEDAYLLSIISNKDTDYFREYLAFLQRQLGSMAPFGPPLLWALSRLYLFGTIPPEIESELKPIIHFIKTKTHMLKEEEGLIWKLLQIFSPKLKTMESIALFFNYNSEFLHDHQNLPEIIPILWDLPRMSPEEISFLTESLNNFLWFQKKFMEANSDHSEEEESDNDIEYYKDIRVYPDLLRVFRILKEEDFLNQFIECNFHLRVDNNFQLWGEHPEYFRRVVTALKHIYDAGIPCKEMDIEFKKFLWQLFFSLFYKQDVWNEEEWILFNNIIDTLFHLHENGSLSDISAIIDQLLKNSQHLSSSNDKLRLWNEILNAIKDYTADNDIEYDLDDYLGAIITILMRIYDSNWQNIGRCFKIALRTYGDGEDDLFISKLQDWLEKHSLPPHFLQYVQQTLLLPEYFKPLLQILITFSTIPEHFQPRLKQFIENWLSPETPRQVPSYINSIIKMEDTERVLRIMGYYKLIHGEFALPERLERIVNTPKMLQNEISFLKQQKEAGKLSSNQLKRLEKLQKQLEALEQFQRTLQKEFEKELKKQEISLPFEALKHHRRQILELWWHGHFADLPFPDNPIYAQNALTLIETSTANKRTLKKLIWLYSKGETIYEHFPENQEFLKDFAKNKGNVSGWLSPYKREFQIKDDVWTVYVSEDPLEILMMGSYFSTCLSPGKGNEFATVANAVEVNKKVLYIRNKNGRVIARKLIALNKRNRLIIGFRTYTHLNKKTGRLWVELLFDLAILDIAKKSNALIITETQKFHHNGNVVKMKIIWDPKRNKRYIGYDWEKYGIYEYALPTIIDSFVFYPPEYIEFADILNKEFSLFAKGYYDDISPINPESIILLKNKSYVFPGKITKMIKKWVMIQFILKGDLSKAYQAISGEKFFHYYLILLQENIIPVIKELMKKITDPYWHTILLKIRPILIGNARTLELEQKLNKKFNEWIKRAKQFREGAV